MPDTYIRYMPDICPIYIPIIYPLYTPYIPLIYLIYYTQTRLESFLLFRFALDFFTLFFLGNSAAAAFPSSPLPGSPVCAHMWASHRLVCMNAVLSLRYCIQFNILMHA